MRLAFLVTVTLSTFTLAAGAGAMPVVSVSSSAVGQGAMQAWDCSGSYALELSGTEEDTLGDWSFSAATARALAPSNCTALDSTHQAMIGLLTGDHVGCVHDATAQLCLSAPVHTGPVAIVQYQATLVSPAEHLNLSGLVDIRFE